MIYEMDNSGDTNAQWRIYYTRPQNKVGVVKFEFKLDVNVVKTSAITVCYNPRDATMQGVQGLYNWKSYTWPAPRCYS